MLKAKIIFNKYGNAFGLLAIFSYLLIFSQPVNAEKTSASKFLEGENQGLPIHRRDGGSRNGVSGRCVDNSRNLIALVPEDRVASTNSTSPSLFFYIPQTTEPKTVEFVLRNEADELVYEDFLTTNGEGIIEVNIPSRVNASLSDKGQNYHWYLSLICNPQQRSRDLVVEGWMRQKPIGLATSEKLSNASNLIEKAKIYQQQGFWYDALAILAERRTTSSENSAVAIEWSNLLQSIGLEELAIEPAIGSNSTKELVSDRSQVEVLPRGEYLPDNRQRTPEESR